MKYKNKNDAFKLFDYGNLYIGSIYFSESHKGYIFDPIDKILYDKRMITSILNRIKKLNDELNNPNK